MILYWGKPKIWTKFWNRILFRTTNSNLSTLVSWREKMTPNASKTLNKTCTSNIYHHCYTKNKLHLKYLFSGCIRLLSTPETLDCLLQGKKDIKVWFHGVYTIKDRRWLRILHSKTDNKSTLILAHDSSTKYIAKTNLDVQEKAD